MSGNGDTKNRVRDFWNKRAALGRFAGTRDLIAKQLEIEAISNYVHDGMNILEVGCGNGITAIEIARQYEVQILGLDFAGEMVAAAKSLASDQVLRGRVKFRVGDFESMSDVSDRFDLIYTERVLVNLPHWSDQERAIVSILALLAEGGLYVMCENSQEGLERLNGLRRRVDLPEIKPPWHNRYLRETELSEIEVEGVSLEARLDYSSTYYFLSRVVNASWAAHENREPDYESPINQLALRLPSIGEYGQGKIWLWRKKTPGV